MGKYPRNIHNDSNDSEDADELHCFYRVVEFQEKEPDEEQSNSNLESNTIHTESKHARCAINFGGKMGAILSSRFDKSGAKCRSEAIS